MSSPDVQDQELAFLFGPFKLLPRRRLVLRGDRALKLSERAVQILSELVRNAGQVVGKNALLALVWPGQFVHESNLKVHIRLLRRALDETRANPSYIATVAGRGYRFIPAVSTASVSLSELLPEDRSIIHNLPPRKTLVGREHEIERVASALAENRFVTLVGSGGVGKTTVAVSVAHQIQDRFADGVCFVDLATSNDSARVPDMLASALGLRGHQADPMKAVVGYLKYRRILIVLDSCEHLLAASAMVATRLHESRVDASLLATSREPLGLSVENIQPISPLAVPPQFEQTSAREAMRYPAVELFAVRALEWADYQLSDSDASTVAAICAALDGVPLAIELAAAKVGPGGVEEVLKALDHSFEPLRKENGDAHGRHRTVWATLDWSYRLLSTDEAQIFQLVSVFAGAFELNDVIAMTRMLGQQPYQTIVGLGSLVEKSLIAAEADDNGLRYRLLDSARSYAAERLSESSLEQEACRSHAQVMLTLFERSAQEWNWSETIEWTKRYEGRSPDLRKALDWCFGPSGDPGLGIRLTVAAIPLWDELSAVAEALCRVERALDHTPARAADIDTCKAKLYVSRAWSMVHTRRLVPETGAAWRVAVEWATRNDDVAVQLRALHGHAIYLIYTGNFELAFSEIARFRQIASQRGDSTALSNAERLRALAEICSGQLRSARDRLAAMADECSHHVTRTRIARFQAEQFVTIHYSLAFVTWLMGDPVRASLTAETAVKHAGRVAHPLSRSNAIGLSALPIAFWNGDYATLERYLTQLKATLEVASIASWLPVRSFFEGMLLHIRGDPSGIGSMQASVDEMLGGRFFARKAMYLSMLAEALIETGEIAAADRTLAHAFLPQECTSEPWYRPELLRIKARLLQAAGDREHERTLQEALAKSIETGARSFELRIASDLASHWMTDQRFDAAVGLLRPVYDRFSEGHQYQDLRRAAGLLESARARLPRVSNL